MPNIAVYEFKQHRAAEARLRSAKHLVKVLLQEDAAILPEHLKEFLSIALWKVTEADGEHKHRTRFCSQAAFNAPDGDLGHDHVFQRALMVKELIANGSDNVDRILEKAVACTITKEEHTRLSVFKAFDGWERYRRAGIVVIDAKTGQALSLQTVS